MFIIPADTRYSQGRIPWMTIGLILTNLLVFFGLQVGDPAFTPQYVFDPSSPGVISAVMHMFMHGGVDHLIGNMVVLALAGMLVEFALGPRLYLAVYVAAGLCGLGLFWLVHIGESVGVLGASGAIAGLMAVFAVLYGRRRMRFFYTLLVYFDFITLPAIALLPYWIGWELLQYLMAGDVPIAYEAHLGGLLGGAVLGWMLSGGAQQPLEERQQEVDSTEQEARWNQSFAEGLVLMGRLETERARILFSRLSAQRPQDSRPRLQLFRIARARPDSESFHRAAGDALACAGLEPRATWPGEVLDDYLGLAKPAPRLSAGLSLDLLEHFARLGDSARVDRLLGSLLRGGNYDPRAAAAIRQLMPKVPPQKARAYQALLDRYFKGV